MTHNDSWTKNSDDAGAVLEDKSLHELGRSGFGIQPYNPDMVQPASVDLTLHDEFRYPRSHVHGMVDLAEGAPEDFTELVITERFVLHPGEFVLGCTRETVVVAHDLVGRLEGKSSLGRLGLIVHVTAGFFDPGFVGRATLEFVNLLRVPIILRPGMLVAQFSFQRLVRPVEQPYDGRYQGDMSVSGSRYGEHGSENADD